MFCWNKQLGVQNKLSNLWRQASMLLPFDVFFQTQSEEMPFNVWHTACILVQIQCTFKIYQIHSNTLYLINWWSHSLFYWVHLRYRYAMQHALQVHSIYPCKFQSYHFRLTVLKDYVKADLINKSSCFSCLYLLLFRDGPNPATHLSDGKGSLKLTLRTWKNGSSQKKSKENTSLPTIKLLGVMLVSRRI